MAMLPNFQDVLDLVKKGSTLEAQEKIVLLREAVLQVQEENLALKRQVATLEEQLAIKGKVLWEKPYYWLVNDEAKDGPFCQTCYDGEKTLIRLQEIERGRWVCNKCKNQYCDDLFSVEPIHYPDWTV